MNIKKMNIKKMNIKKINIKKIKIKKKLYNYHSDRFLKKINLEKIFDIKVCNTIIIASDFETISINDKLYVYCVGILFNNNNYFDFFVDFEKDIVKESSKLIKEYLFFLENKFDTKKKLCVYFHNLGSFDGYFLMEYFMKYHEDQIDCLIKDNKIFYIKYKNITFLDSYNIIPYSIDEIGNIYLNKGKSLEITEYDSLDTIKKNFIDIKKYLYNDVYILYTAIIIFYNKFLLEKVNITEKFTLSSIAFQIYRMKYMNNVKIRTTRFNNYVFLKKTYLGGLNFIRIPYIENGYYYDINSLYPYIMKTCQMPVGDFSIIKNNFLSIDNYFGFIYCTVYVNQNIDIPPLLLKIGKRDNLQATGYITGYWFSEEIKFAVSIGVVVIEIFEVYSFEEKKIIFSDYIDYFYNKRIHSTNKGDSLIYKLIMNSLYGKFGTNLSYNKIVRIEDKDLYPYELTHEILNKFGEKTYNISINWDLYNQLSCQQRDISDYEDKIEKMISSQKHQFSTSNVCVHISSAIASYARIKLLKDMYFLMKDKNYKIYYYDTDAIFVDKLLPNDMVSNQELGKYKLVDEIKKGYFISCKIYGYVNNKGEEIIKFKGLEKKEKKKLSIEIYKNIYENMKQIEESKKDIIKYSFNQLKKHLSSFSIYNKKTTFEPVFTSHKQKNIYCNNKSWILTQYIHQQNWFYFLKNLFNLFRSIMSEIEYYKFIYNIFK
jgi:hypothetical protein